MKISLPSRIFLAGLGIAWLTGSAALAGCVPGGPATTTTAVTTSLSTSVTTTGSQTTGTVPTTASEPTTTASVPTPTTVAPPVRTVSDYFPLTPDVTWQYTGVGHSTLQMSVIVDYVRPNQIQLSTNNGATEIRKLYRVGNGVVQLLKEKPELYVREDLSVLKLKTSGEILLKEPIAVGTSWPAGDNTRTITRVDCPVTTPAGTFQTVEVTEVATDITTRWYYAPDVGYVKMSVTGAYEMLQELAARQTGKPLSQALTLYYPRATANDVEITCQELTVKMKTNTGLKEILTSYFRKPPADGLIPLIAKDVKINKITSNQAKGIATIDFSANLVTEMNLGASFEAAVLRCITNSVGHAYDFRKVIITVDGQPYASGHFDMAPGEAFTVDYKNMVRLP